MLNFTHLLIWCLNGWPRNPPTTASYLWFTIPCIVPKTSLLLKEQAEFTNKNFTSLCPYGSDDPMGCEMKSYLGRCRGWRNVPRVSENSLFRFSFSSPTGKMWKHDRGEFGNEFQPKPDSFAIVTMRTSQRGSRELVNVYFTSQLALTTSILASSESGGVGPDAWPINWWVFGISLLIFPRGNNHKFEKKTCSTNLVWVRIFQVNFPKHYLSASRNFSSSFWSLTGDSPIHRFLL